MSTPQAERKGAHCVARKNACQSERFRDSCLCILKMILRISKRGASVTTHSVSAGRGAIEFECRQINIATTRPHGVKPSLIDRISSIVAVGETGKRALIPSGNMLGGDTGGRDAFLAELTVGQFVSWPKLIPKTEANMGFGRGVLLWILGVPIPIIILLALFWHH